MSRPQRSRSSRATSFARAMRRICAPRCRWSRASISRPAAMAGPTSSVPALWGLREFDAFLLVVDGIPWGGAFTPALASLDVANVERIEVLKGAAPVSYGATSFVGVIHVIHYAAGPGSGARRSWRRNRGSARISVVAPLSDANAPWQQSLLFDADTVGLSSDRTGWDRAHLSYRGAAEVGGGQFTFDADGTCLNQDPTSPHPAEDVSFVASRAARCERQSARRQAGRESRPAHLRLCAADQHRRLEHAARVCAQRRRQRARIPARGLRRRWRNAQRRRLSAGRRTGPRCISTATSRRRSTIKRDPGLGLDYLYGKGDQESNNFEYAVLPNGSNAPDWHSLHIDETTRLTTSATSLGFYADLEYCAHRCVARRARRALQSHQRKDERSRNRSDRRRRRS